MRLYAREMYLVSVYEQEGIVEASLGGRLTACEVRTLQSDLCDLMEGYQADSFQLLLDYSMAKRLDPETREALHDMKDACLTWGIRRIVSVTQSEEEAIVEKTARLQNVMEGSEEISDRDMERPVTGVPKPWTAIKAA